MRLNIFKKYLELMDKKSKEFLIYKVNHILFRRKYEMKKKILNFRRIVIFNNRAGY